MRATQGQRRAAGFTLIELVVVLMILAALAGLLVPNLNGFVERSHAATSATDIGEVTKNLELYRVKYLDKGYPSNLDSLVASDDSEYQGMNPALAAVLTPTAIVANQALSLTDAGIVEVARHLVGPVPAGTSATDGVTVLPLAVATGVNLQFLDDAVASIELGATTQDLAKYRYVAFGVGHNNAAVGKTMLEAPIHFDTNPELFYSRYIVVFGVPRTPAVPGFKAELKGVIGSDAEGLNAHIQEYHKAP